MTSLDDRSRYASVTAGARVFALLMLALPVAVNGTIGPILSVVLLAAVWLAAVFVEGFARVPIMPALVIEASLVTLLAALTLAESPVLLPALGVPLFVAGLVRGSRGLLEVLGAEAMVLVATTVPNDRIRVEVDLVSTVFTWLMVGVGLGAIGAVVHNLKGEESSTAGSYREARSLITRLLDLSGDLVDGLDPLSIAQNIIDLSKEEVPISGAVVFTRDERGITPLLEGDVRVDHTLRDGLVTQVFRGGRAVVQGSDLAFPLLTEAGVIGVVQATMHPAFGQPKTATLAALNHLSQRLGPEAVQLDTALLFASIQADATSEERQRLARDLHDGIAQDLAAFGYLIDGVEDLADSPEQQEAAQELRDELSRVVTELRRSIFGLRNEAASELSLGESVRAMAEHITSRTGLPIDITLDEDETRLRSDVETELLRIVQEGMNNAVKHARASRIRVACVVHPPYARVRVIDNGRGLQESRDDSHGLRIMRERARRIGGSLELRNRDGRPGTELSVELNRASRPKHLANTTEWEA
ncbi:sensor histidine kinase [Nocardioides daejeonensis]|uniref:sensor histidine kinase n=1 Tax=Nocardioides daejeonensis TaxID=1046556 RepID=UPI000D74D551|nr:sensor histidine kinase [Nocardioides daejeonensis]